MAQQTLNNGESGLVIRNKINDNFTEVYTKQSPVCVMLYTPLLTLTNQPSAEEVLGNANFLVIRPTLQTSTFTQIRMGARVNVASASANSPRLYVKYTTGLTVTPSFTLIGDGTIASGHAVDLSAQGQKLTNWIDLPAGAIGASITFQPYQIGGDGVADPQLTTVWLEFR